MSAATFETFRADVGLVQLRRGVTSATLDRSHVEGGGDGETHPSHGLTGPSSTRRSSTTTTAASIFRRLTTVRWSSRQRKIPPSGTFASPRCEHHSGPYAPALTIVTIRGAPTRMSSLRARRTHQPIQGADQREMFLPATGDKIGGKQRGRRSRQPDRGNAASWHPGVRVTEQARVGRIHFRCGRGRVGLRRRGAGDTEVGHDAPPPSPNPGPGGHDRAEAKVLPGLTYRPTTGWCRSVGAWLGISVWPAVLHPVRGFRHPECEQSPRMSTTTADAAAWLRRSAQAVSWTRTSLQRDPAAVIDCATTDLPGAVTGNVGYLRPTE